MEVTQVLNWYSGMHMTNENAPDISDGDAKLMLRFKGGDREAFDQLFARHTHAMINFAYRFVRDRCIAEELAQEIFLRVYEGAANYTVRSKFRTWLYRIATNVCLNEVRKPRFKAAHQPLSMDFEPDHGTMSGESSGSGPHRVLERQAIAHALREALDRLPEKQRAAFVLNKYQELSYVEVAGIMKTSEKAVKSLIHRAKETLAERLKLSMPELLRR